MLSRRMMLTGLAVPHLAKTGGAIIFFGSVHTRRAYPGASPYAATKGADRSTVGVPGGRTRRKSITRQLCRSRCGADRDQHSCRSLHTASRCGAHAGHRARPPGRSRRHAGPRSRRPSSISSAPNGRPGPHWSSTADCRLAFRISEPRPVERQSCVEMRTYTFAPGAVRHSWRPIRPGIGHPDARSRQPLGYFSTEIGVLNQTVHLWGYEGLDDRLRRRAAAEPPSGFLADIAFIGDAGLKIHPVSRRSDDAANRQTGD